MKKLITKMLELMILPVVLVLLLVNETMSRHKERRRLQGKKDALADFFNSLVTLNDLFGRTKVEYTRNGLKEHSAYQRGIIEAIGIIESKGYRLEQLYVFNDKTISTYQEAKIAIVCTGTKSYDQFMRMLAPGNKQDFIMINSVEKCKGLQFKSYIVLHDGLSLNKRATILTNIRSRIIHY